MKEKLLSIAIPTYNRAEIVARTLENLFSNPDFDEDKIEVVVSDNASTDHTAEVVARYPRVRYFRNETNIGYGNFTVAFNRCSGKYLRMMNDTVWYNEGMLGKMLRELEAADSERENIYFANTPPFSKSQSCVTNNSDGVLRIVSFYVTWIANLGMWRADFEKIEDKDRFVDTLLQQVDWLLKSFDGGKPTKVVLDDFVSLKIVKDKVRYDFYEVFVTNYLRVLKAHKVGFFTMRVEKYRLFRYFLLPNLKVYKGFTLDMTNRAVVRKKYWYEPYYLPFMLLYNPVKRIYRRCSKK